MIKFGLQGRREEKVLGKVLEKREEKKMAFGIEIQSWVLRRRVERERERERERIQSWGLWGFKSFDYIYIYIDYNIKNKLNII